MSVRSERGSCYGLSHRPLVAAAAAIAGAGIVLAAPAAAMMVAAEAQAALVELFGGPNSPDNLHTELMAPLPSGIYRNAQVAAYNALIDYMNYVNTHPPNQSASVRTLERAWAY